jgi:hypothetical protein
MKIKEVLVEGPLDFAKGLWKTGSLSGAKAASQQAAGQKELQGLVNNVIGKWNLYYGQTQDQNIAAWAKKFFGGDVSSIQPPNVSDANDVNDYITTLVKAYKAGQLNPAQSTPKYKQRQSAVTPIQPTAPQPSAGTGTISATGKRGATQTPQQPQAYQNPLNITIRQSTDPIIVDYQGKPYMLNDRGEWARNAGNTKAAEASGAVQAEIDKVLAANNLR